MPQTGNYSITIEVGGNIENDSPISGDKGNKSDTEKGKGLLSKQGAKTFAKGLVAYHTLKSYTDQIVSHHVSTVELRTGSRELQERANFMLDITQKSIGIAESVLSGAMVGGIGGAAVGLLIGFAHTAISYQQKQQTLDLQETLENQTLRMNYIRAGAGGSRRQ